MRIWIALAVVLAAVPAGAEPCAVTIAHAPDDVREVVENWVQEQESPRWLALGVMVPMAGIRGEIDLLGWGHWSIGLALSFASARGFVDDYGEFGSIDARFWKGLAYLARTLHLGRWTLRPSFGLGMVLATGHVEQLAPMEDSYHLSKSYGTAQGSLLLGRLIGDNWSIHAGPIATLALPRSGVEMEDQISTEQLVSLDPDVVLYAGVQRRLW